MAKALDLSEGIDSLTKTFPKQEVYVLTSQMKRAADSVALNIAEGSTGQSNVEYIRFLRYALRSDIEVVGCLYLGRKRKYITEELFLELYKLCEEILLIINALIKSMK